MSAIVPIPPIALIAMVIALMEDDEEDKREEERARLEDNRDNHNLSQDLIIKQLIINEDKYKQTNAN
jgi:hypothetical protein